MKFSLNWLNRYTPLPIGDVQKLNEVIDRIALQIVDVDERWVSETDAIIDVDNKIITNRPYDFGHRGLAKEISIMLDQSYTGNEYPSIPVGAIHELPLQIEVNDPDLCPRFTTLVIKNVKVGPSPDFIRYAVESIGLRSINNIVDITNMIMLDTAQPVHAYDYKKIAGNKIIVRRAQKDEKIKTLDGIERVLNENTLLITDSEKAIGIGGVMGAGNSEIDETTTDIILEVASFNPINIRQTAKYLKHRTDAVTRFEKGIDPTNIPNVMGYLSDLIIHICGGEVASDFIDINNLNLSTIRTEDLKMEFNPKRVDKLLGFGIQEDFIRKVLNGFSIGIEERSETEWTLSIPPSRPDVKETADIIEDIGRMYGYQNIPNTTPINQLLIPPINNKIKVKQIIRQVLTSSGLDEVITYSMISQKDVDTFNLSDSIKIVNPLSEDYLYLRKSLLPSLTKVASLNAKYFDSFGLFEVSRKYEKKNIEVLPYDQDKGESMQPIETELLTLMYYSKTEKEKSIFNIKGAVENLMEKLGIKNYSITSEGNLNVNEESIGNFGVLNQNQLKAYDLAYPVSYVELNIDSIYKNFTETKSFKEYSKFQNSKLNYTAVIPENVPADTIINTILSNVKDETIKNITYVGEIYRDEKNLKDKKSVSIEIILQKNEGNLTDNEIYDLAEKIESQIKSIPNAEIKGGGIIRKQANSQNNPTIQPSNTVTHIIAAEILSIENHENADKLVVTQVNTGSEKYQIVTGAPNIKVGDLVPVALPGTAVPGLKDELGNNIIMKMAKLRGVESYGMMLAGDELGVNSDHEGIYLLDKSKYKVGDEVKPEELK